MPRPHLRALLIDPARRTVCELSLLGAGDSGEQLDAMRAVIGADVIDIRMLTRSHMLVLDDEGLFKLAEGEPADVTEIGGQIIAGRSLILGATDDGGSASASLKVEDVLGAIKFSRRVYSGIESFDEGLVDHPVFGKVFSVGSRALFGPALEDRQ